MANERLRAAIATAGLTIEDVAARAEVDPKTVERWIRLGRLPHRAHRFATAKLLGRDEGVPVAGDSGLCALAARK